MFSSSCIFVIYNYNFHLALSFWSLYLVPEFTVPERSLPCLMSHIFKFVGYTLAELSKEWPYKQLHWQLWRSSNLHLGCDIKPEQTETASFSSWHCYARKHSQAVLIQSINPCQCWNTESWSNLFFFKCYINLLV